MSTFSGTCEEFVMVVKVFTPGFSWSNFVANNLAMPPLFETGYRTSKKVHENNGTRPYALLRVETKPKE